jgi:hypothetical protein
MSGYAGPFPYDGLTTISPKLQQYAVAREPISQYGAGRLGIEIVQGSSPINVEQIWLDVLIDVNFDETTTSEIDWSTVEGEPLAFYTNEEITHEGPGRYSVELGHVLTSRKGLIVARWQYVVNSEVIEHKTYAIISDPMPTYEALDDRAKEMVRLTQVMLADLFDSTDGGPWLTENFQTKFNAERIAQLATVAMNRINIIGIPVTNFRLEVKKNFPPRTFESLLSMGIYLETLRHLIRSYTEQPNFSGMSTTYTDRRDYAQRWRSILDEEKPMFEKAVKTVKRSLLGLGGGALLVSGGIYGGSGGYFKSGMYAAQTRSMRMYPYPLSVVRI